MADIEHFDFIAYLDADNWYHPHHLSSLLDLHNETAAEVCCSMRTFHALDGTELKGLEETDENEFKHVDTSCFLLHRRAFKLTELWYKMPRRLSPVCDRVFFSAILDHGYRTAYTKQRTVAFRSQYASHYLAMGLDPPDGAKRSDAFECVNWLYSLDGARETVKRLGFLPKVYAS